jgi:hypothetical protein
LGYFIAETMAVRDALKAGDYSETMESIWKRSNVAWKLGANPEYWKLTWVLLLKRGLRSLNKKQWQQAAKAWLLCEYTLSLLLGTVLAPTIADLALSLQE